MQLRIDHDTTHNYSEAASYSIQYLRLTPRPHGHQAVLDWSVSGPGRLNRFVDAHGNIVHVLAVTKPHTSVTVGVHGEVATRETHGVLPAEAEALPPRVYLRETGRTKASSELHEFALGFAQRWTRDQIACLHSLMLDIRERIAYRVGATDVDSTAAEAFAKGSGVCQDHAHVFISACRTLGIPARYISGYLSCGEEQLDGAAGHAWAEALVPDLGWVGYDVSNAICVHEGYVRVAAGLDYGDAMPVRGVRRGGGTESLDVRVRVQEGSTIQ